MFLHFHAVHGVLLARLLEWFTISPPVDQSELFTMTHSSLGTPYIAWLITSLVYPSPFATNKAVIHKEDTNIYQRVKCPSPSYFQTLYTC